MFCLTWAVRNDPFWLVFESFRTLLGLFGPLGTGGLGRLSFDSFLALLGFRARRARNGSVAGGGVVGRCCRGALLETGSQDPVATRAPDRGWKIGSPTAIVAICFGLPGPFQTMIVCPEIKQKQPQDRKTLFEILSLPVTKILLPVARQAPTKGGGLSQVKTNTCCNVKSFGHTEGCGCGLRCPNCKSESQRFQIATTWNCRAPAKSQPKSPLSSYFTLLSWISFFLFRGTPCFFELFFSVSQWFSLAFLKNSKKKIR